MKGLGNHRILVPCDIRTTGIAQIEDGSHIRLGLRTGEIARHQAAHILRKRHAQFGGALPSAPVRLTL